MKIVVRETHVDVDGSPMRVRLARPAAVGRFPGVLLYSEIFQLTGPILRSADRLAGHGFVVAAPEIFHRVEAPGAVIPYDDAGRTRGLAAAKSTVVAAHDRDRAAALDVLAADPSTSPGGFGAMGFCIGGHLALRAALDPRVKAAVACYPTGVHDGALGSDADAGTLGRLGAVAAALLVVFGTEDPHVPAAGRDAVTSAIGAPRADRRVVLHPAEHAFMRDEGPRYDPAAADAVWAAAIPFLREFLPRAG